MLRNEELSHARSRPTPELLESAVGFSAPTVRALTQQVDVVEVKARTSAAEKRSTPRPVPAPPPGKIDPSKPPQKEGRSCLGDRKFKHLRAGAGASKPFSSTSGRLSTAVSLNRGIVAPGSFALARRRGRLHRGKERGWAAAQQGTWPEYRPQRGCAAGGGSAPHALAHPL